jgi:signal peptidase I
MENTDPVPEQPASNPPWWSRMVYGRNIRTTLVRASISAVILVVLFKLVLLPVRITGMSMLPTYRNGTINFVNRAAFWFREPRRGDVVGYALTGEHAMYFKRVIAVPGETIEIRDGVVRIDGNVLDEPYLVYRAPWREKPVTLATNEYFLIGDNRGMDQQSHEHGRGLRSHIVGKALW